MKKLKKIAYYLGIALVLIAMWGFSIRNSLLTSQAAITTSWDQLESHLRRRYTLADSFLKYAAQNTKIYRNETQHFTSLHLAVSMLQAAQSPSEKSKLIKQIEKQLYELIELTQHDPISKRKDYPQLITEIRESGEAIVLEAENYNAQIKFYNDELNKKPARWIARWSGFKKIDPLDVSAFKK